MPTSPNEDSFWSICFFDGKALTKSVSNTNNLYRILPVTMLHVNAYSTGRCQNINEETAKNDDDCIHYFQHDSSSILYMQFKTSRC